MGRIEGEKIKGWRQERMIEGWGRARRREARKDPARHEERRRQVGRWEV